MSLRDIAQRIQSRRRKDEDEEKEPTVAQTRIRQAASVARNVASAIVTPGRSISNLAKNIVSGVSNNREAIARQTRPYEGSRTSQPIDPPDLRDRDLTFTAPKKITYEDFKAGRATLDEWQRSVGQERRERVKQMLPAGLRENLFGSRPVGPRMQLEEDAPFRAQIANEFGQMNRERGFLGVWYSEASKTEQDLYDQYLESMLKRGVEPARAALIAADSVTGGNQIELTKDEKKGIRNAKLMNTLFLGLEALDVASFGTIGATRNVAARAFRQLSKIDDAAVVREALEQVVPDLRGDVLARVSDEVAQATTPRQVESIVDAAVNEVRMSRFSTEEMETVTQTLRGTKGLTADDIMKTHPNIKLTRDVPATDVYGNKEVIPKGEKLTPYEMKDGKVLLQDGQAYLVSKNQFQNIRGNTVGGEAKPFAPELDNLEFTVKGGVLDEKSTARAELENQNIFFEQDMSGEASLVNRQGDLIEYDELTPAQRRMVDLVIDDAETFDQISTTKYSKYTLPGSENYREILVQVPETMKKGEYGDVIDKAQTFRSSHWEEPNVLAHLRIANRDWDGKKVTFLEELQSDWARDFRGGKTSLESPMLKDWQTTSLKRALIDAVEDGSDVFAWINGRQTSERYQLSREIKKVDWEPDQSSLSRLEGGYKNIILHPKKNDSFNMIIDKTGKVYFAPPAMNAEGKMLDEVVGKGMADSIMSKSSGNLSGKGLNFGGEWAFNLYDKQVRDIVKKLTGAEVKEADMGIGTGKEVRYKLAGSDSFATSKNVQVGDLINDPDYESFYIVGKNKNGSVDITPMREVRLQLENDYDLYQKYMPSETSIENLNEAYYSAISDGVFKNNALTERINLDNLASQKQQYIEMTPEVVARIKGEALDIQTSGNMFGTPTVAGRSGEAFAGGIFGIEEDENGNISFDPIKAGLGMTAGFLFSRARFKDDPNMPDWRKTDSYMQAEYEIYAEMVELSQPGHRVFLPHDATRQEPSVIGVKSTFPKWIPEHLRLKKMFVEVFEYIEKGIRPANPKGTIKGENLQELYDLVYDEILARQLQIDSTAANARVAHEFLIEQAQFADPSNTVIIPTVKGIKGEMPKFAPPKNIKKVIGDNLIRPRVNRVTMSEKAFLKQRLLNQSKGARAGMREGAALEKALQKNIAQNKIDELKRKGELKQLRQRIKDRETFVNRGARKGEVETKAYIKDVQTRVTNLIKDSNLSLNDKAKLLPRIKNIQTIAQLEKAEPALRSRIQDLIRADLTRTLKSEISKTLKKSKTKTLNSIRRGKLTAETQGELDFINRVLKMSRADGLVEASELAVKHAENMTPEIARQIDLLRMAGLKDMNLNELLQTSDQVKTLFETGRTLNELRAFNRVEEINRLRGGTIDALGGAVQGTESVGVDKKAGNALLRAIDTVDNWLQGIDTILDKVSVFDKTSTGKFDGFLNRQLGDRIHEARRAKNYGLRVWTENIQDNFLQIFGTKKRSALAKIVNENKTPSVKFEFVNANGVKVSRMLTPNQVYKKYMEMQDPTLASTFTEGMGWTPDATRQINDYMASNPKLKAWADWQLKEFYPEYGQSVAPIYQDRFNVPFPVRENYSPIKRTGINTMDDGLTVLDDAYHRAGTTPGSLKNRVANTNPLEFTDGDEVLTRHVIEMEHFKAFDGVVRDLRAVFSDPTVKNTMDARFGPSARKMINRLVDEVARDGVNTAEMVVALDKLRANFTRSVLAINPVVTLKQLASIPAFITEMPGGAMQGMYDFGKYSVQFWKNPIKNFNELKNTEFMRARGANMDREVRTVMQSSTYKKVLTGQETFQNQMMLNVQLGDQGAILYGGWAVYRSNLDKLLKQGVPEAKAKQMALKKFEAATRRTQQAGEPENLSVIQQTGGSIGKLFSMFLTAPNAYYRIASRSLRNLYYGRGSKVENARNVLIAWVVLPMVFQYISDGFRFDERRQKRAAALGPLNGIPILGESIDDVVRALTGDDVFDGQAPGPLTILGKAALSTRRAIREVQNQSFDMGDMLKLIEDYSVTAGNLFGYPVGSVISMAKGSGDALQSGDPRRIIFSKYALDDGTGFSDAEKKVLPVYTQARIFAEQGQREAAQSLIDELSDEEYEVYRSVVTKSRARETEDGKVAMRPRYREIRRMADSGDTEGAMAMVEAMSDEEYRIYQLVVAEEKRKEAAKAGQLPFFNNNESTEADSVVEVIALYAKALSITPIQAFSAIFQGETIRRVDNRTVIVHRMPLEESQQIRIDRAEDPSMLPELRLDHTIPLQLGGLNTEDNLVLVPKDVWESWTPVENFLGQKLRNKEVSRQVARNLITRFKRGEISAEDVYNYFE